jgi:23S rRNA (guanosine2251-2'-O)-methyltransferase
VTSQRRNDRRFHHQRGRSDGRETRAPGDWLWGVHAVTAALSNPRRGPPRRLLATADRAQNLAGLASNDIPIEIVEVGTLSAVLPPGAVHQGIAVDLPVVEPTALAELAQSGVGLLVMLDQITDPQNVGAIFRSAAALGARGVILQDRHAPALTGALAKAAAGAIDKIPHARETNLSRALERLDRDGWRAIGLDGCAEAALGEVLDGRPTVLVLGSEGAGLRRLVAEHCDVLARIPMVGTLESLNVSAAAAIAIFEAMKSVA